MTYVVNYDAIVQELEKGLKLSTDHSLNCLGLTDKSDQLKELFTVGVRLPRQTGTTRFVLESMIKHPDSITVVPTEFMKNFFMEILGLMISASKQNNLVSSRGNFHYQQSQEIKDLILNDPDILNNIKSRLIPMKKLYSFINGNVVLENKFSRIYLYHGTSIFSSIRNKKYYDWLAKQSDNHISTWVIN